MLSGAPTSRVLEIVNTRKCVEPNCTARPQVDVATCPACGTEQPAFLLRAPLSRRAVQSYMQSVRVEIQQEFQEARSQLAADQVERLRNDLLRMRSMPRIPWPSVSQHERLLAEITGTFAPRRLVLTGSEGLVSSLATVLAGMTPEERERAVAEQKALMLRAGVDTIEAHGEPVASSPHESPARSAEHLRP